LENRIHLGGFVVNIQRNPNDDPKLVHLKDQATVIYMDPNYLMQPMHTAKVPLYMLDRAQTEKICNPVGDVSARWAI
jgi:hypothetical protein